MLNKFSKFILFLFAYLPVFISLIIKIFYDIEPITINIPLSNLSYECNFIILTLIISITLSFTIIALCHLIIKSVREIVPEKELVCIIEPKNSEYLAFIVTYLIPILVVGIDIPTIISIVIIFIIISIIYIDSSLFCINPLLKIIFRYNIYEIEISKKRSYLLSKRRLYSTEMNLNIKQLGDGVYIDDGE